MADLASRKRAAWVAAGGLAAGVLALIANIDGAWSFGERLFGGTKTTATATQSGTAPQNTPATMTTTTVLAVAPNTQDPVPTKTANPAPTTAVNRPRGPLLISFAFADGLAVGKDKARACNTSKVWCTIVKDSVSNDSGRINSGCTLSWRLYTDGSQTQVENGSVPCNSFSGIRLGVKKPMPQGGYRLDADVELNDGFKGSGSYSFTMVD